MEKKKTTVQQRKAIEIALVLFCVGTILFSWMTDMSLIKIPEELLMEISSIEDLNLHLTLPVGWGMIKVKFGICAKGVLYEYPGHQRKSQG